MLSGFHSNPQARQIRLLRRIWRESRPESRGCKDVFSNGQVTSPRYPPPSKDRKDRQALILTETSLHQSWVIDRVLLPAYSRFTRSFQPRFPARNEGKTGMLRLIAKARESTTPVTSHQRYNILG